MTNYQYLTASEYETETLMRFVVDQNYAQHEKNHFSIDCEFRFVLKEEKEFKGATIYKAIDYYGFLVGITGSKERKASMIMVHDAMGHVKYSQKLEASEGSIGFDTTPWLQGVYIVTIVTPDKPLQAKLLKE